MSEVPEKRGRGRGRLYKEEFILTDEQRLALGTDRWFTVKEIAAYLGISEQAIRNSIDRGVLKAFMVPQRRGGPVMKVKGLRVVAWRDQCAGLSDGREDDFPKVG